MYSVFREDSTQDSSSGCDSDTEENLLLQCFPGSKLSEEDRLKAVQRLPRQKGHYKLKIRHQVENGPGKKAYHVTHLQGSDSSALEKSATRSQILASIKQTLENENKANIKDESQTVTLEALCASSIRTDTKESTVNDHPVTSSRSSEDGDEVEEESEVIVDIQQL